MITITTKTPDYAEAKCCIYCGTTRGKLTDEHIVPFGLGGDSLILKKASCTACQDATKRFETVCLRHLWWPFRTHSGVPSRGRDKTPVTFSLKRMRVDEYDAESDRIVSYTQLGMDDIPADDYPLFYQTISLPQAGVLAGRQNSEDVEYQLWCKLDQTAFRKHILSEKEGFRLGPGSPENLCRLFAKIAHGYAVAEIGTEHFEPILAEYIRGDPLDRLQWIGGLDETAATKELHQIQFSQQTIGDVDYLTVDLRLFGCIGAPTHRIVVGKLKKPLSEIILKSRHPFVVEFEGSIPFSDPQVLTGRCVGGWSDDAAA